MNYKIFILLIVLLAVVGCARSTIVGPPNAAKAQKEIRDISDEMDQESPSISKRGPEASLKPSLEKIVSLKSLDEYIAYGLKNSSSLKAAFASYQSATSKLSQATALPDPRLSYGYFLRSVETRVGPQRHKVGLSQSFPWFGTLDLQGDVADSEAQAEFFRFLGFKNKLVYEISKTYAELGHLQSAIKITDETLQLVKSWEEVLRERFRVGTGSHADLVKVQVELGRLEDRLAELKDLKSPFQVEMNSLINREVSAEVYVEKDPDAWEQSFPGAIHWQQLSFIDVENHNPELKMLDALIEARRSGVRLAEKKYYPDFTLGMDYIVTGGRDVLDGGEDAVMAMFSINLPIFWEKNRAGVKEASYEKKSVEQLRKDRKYRLQSAFSKAKFDLRDTLRKISLYRDTLVPKAEESIQASYTLYETGKAGFLDVLDSEQSLLEYSLLLSRAWADKLIAKVELLKLVGEFNEKASINKEDENENVT